MGNKAVNKVLYGLKPREGSSRKGGSKRIVIDSYVPKACGSSIVEEIKNSYGFNIRKKREG